MAENVHETKGTTQALDGRKPIQQPPLYLSSILFLLLFTQRNMIGNAIKTVYDINCMSQKQTFSCYKEACAYTEIFTLV